MLDKLVLRALGTVVLTVSISTSLQASTVDWTGVIFEPTDVYPTYHFSDAALGDVTISYSPDPPASTTGFYGIKDIFGVVGDDTLVLGDTGVESVTISWTNDVLGLQIPIWDVDGATVSTDTISGTAVESVEFVTTATVTDVSLNANVWDASTLTLSSDGTGNANQNPTGYSLMSFVNPAGFSSITFDFGITTTGDDIGYTGGIGIGDLEITAVPVPAAIWLFGSGLIGLIGIAKRRKS